MKNVFKMMALSLVAVATLAACGKKGGGSSATTGAYGGVYGGYSNVSGYAGEGVWSGTLNITNHQVLNQMYQEHGRCRGYGGGIMPYAPIGVVQPQIAFQCVQATFLRLSLSIPEQRDGGQIVSPAGYVPGRGYFQMVPVLNGSTRNQPMFAKNTDARMNGAANGFVLTLTPKQNQFNGSPFIFPGQPAIQQAGALDIATTWTDASHSILNVTVLYKGTIFAQGQVLNRSVGIGQGAW